MSANSQPAYDAVAVDISADDDLLTDRGTCDALYIGADGDIAFVTKAGRAVVMTVGQGVLPVGAVSITKTGTTATGIFALYTGV